MNKLLHNILHHFPHLCIFQHIHNTKYIDIALEALPSHMRISASFSEIRIVYSKAIKESDEVVTNYSLVNHAHVITVMGNNAPCTIIELK